MSLSTGTNTLALNVSAGAGCVLGASEATVVEADGPPGSVTPGEAASASAGGASPPAATTAVVGGTDGTQALSVLLSVVRAAPAAHTELASLKLTSPDGSVTVLCAQPAPTSKRRRGGDGRAVDSTGGNATAPVCIPGA